MPRIVWRAVFACPNAVFGAVRVQDRFLAFLPPIPGVQSSRKSGSTQPASSSIEQTWSITQPRGSRHQGDPSLNRPLPFPHAS
jgi:hypothetical protein